MSLILTRRRGQGFYVEGTLITVTQLTGRTSCLVEVAGKEAVIDAATWTSPLEGVHLMTTDCNRLHNSVKLRVRAPGLRVLREELWGPLGHDYNQQQQTNSSKVELNEK